MVWSKIHSQPGPVTSADCLQVFWDYLQTTGWRCLDDIAGAEGSRVKYRLEYDYEDVGSGETATLKYWIETENVAGYEIYGDPNGDGSFTIYDTVCSDNYWGSGDLTVWTSDDPETDKAILITLNKSVLFFWFGFQSAWIPNPKTPAQMGYPMPLFGRGSTGSHWYGSPIEVPGDSQYGYQCLSTYPQGTYFPSAALNGYKPFLTQGFGVSAIEYNYQYPIAEWTWINSQDILQEVSLIRNGDKPIMTTAVSTMGVKFDGTNYFLTLHDGSRSCGTNIWLPVGNTEPSLLHDADPA